MVVLVCVGSCIGGVYLFALFAAWRREALTERMWTRKTGQPWTAPRSLL